MSVTTTGSSAKQTVVPEAFAALIKPTWKTPLHEHESCWRGGRNRQPHRHDSARDAGRGSEQTARH